MEEDAGLIASEPSEAIDLDLRLPTSQKFALMARQ